MKRTKLFALLAAFVVALGIFAASAFAADPAPSLSIKTFNLSVENAVYMVFKVTDESVETGDMRLLVWENVPEAYKKGTEDACLTSNEVESGTGYTVFRYTDLAAKDMTKTVYACAYANVNGTEVYSAPVKYSIVMYADMKKTASDPDEDLVAFLDTMLAYGAAAQTYFGHNTGFLATDEVHKVTVVNGTLSDGFSLGWVKAGTTVTVTANAPAEGYVFSHWADATGASVATTETAELPVDKVETYTAGYRSTVQEYSQGLEYATNDDGTCYVVGMGDCTDTDVVIPATSPDNDTVIGIDRSAFANEAITSITLPNTVEEIGRQAFNGCTALTDVYYDGTEDEWNEKVTVATSGNTAFLNATMHFKMPPVEDEEEYTEPTVTISSESGTCGEEVTLTFRLASSPDLYALSLKLAFDDTALQLVSATNGSSMGAFTYTAPSRLKDGANFIWYANDPANANGTVLTMVFKINDTATQGNYAVSMICDPDNTFDGDGNPVDLQIVDGCITVTD